MISTSTGTITEPFGAVSHADSTRILTRLPDPRSIGLPFEAWRKPQEDAAEWFRGDNGDWLTNPFQPPPKVRILEAPTGTGKSPLVLGLTMMYPDRRFLILCSTKLEQEQYENQLTTSSKVPMVSIKGKPNFHCRVEHPEFEGWNEDCEEPNCQSLHVSDAPCQASKKVECPQKQDCFYYYRVQDAKDARVVVTNYAYGLNMLQVSGKSSGGMVSEDDDEGEVEEAARGLGKFDVIICDEAHVLDQELERFIAIRLVHRIIERTFDLDVPTFRGGGSIPQWALWCENNLHVLEEKLRSLPRPNKSSSKGEVRLRLLVQRYIGYFKRVMAMESNWVCDVDSNGTDFKPVWVTKDAEWVLWNRAQRFILMSGTIPNGRELAKKVGIDKKDFTFKRLPYIFPPEHRPIVIRPSVDLSVDHIDDNLALLTAEVDSILSQNLMKKALIHTKSYKIANYLIENSQYGTFMFGHSAADRVQVLEQFREEDAPAILVSPSFDKAVDLPGDQCELIIIAKLPFPYLGTKVMRRRLSENRRYYDHETLMSAIQMAGRGVRGEEDQCTTYVLDAAGTKFFKRTRGMIPDAIKDAIFKEEDIGEEDTRLGSRRGRIPFFDVGRRT